MVVIMFGHCVGGSCCHKHHGVMAVAPSTTSATPPFTSNSTIVEWKIGPPETVNTHSDSDSEASAEAFIADKV